MCGRYSLLNPNQLVIRFGVANQLEPLVSNDDIRPTQSAPIVKMGRQAALVRWGLIPFWAKDPAVGQKMINARAEGLDQKPSFRKPLRASRCLVPATSFYEWKPSDTGKGKIKYRFSVDDDEMFGLAGLYDTWVDPEGKPRETFTIITTTPNEVVAPVHDRMPVILSRAAEEIWLDPDEDDTMLLLSYLKPYPAEHLLAQVA